MKNIVVIILMVLLASCLVSKKSVNKNIQLIKAEKQAYTLGVRMDNGKTTGITHSLYFDIKAGIKIEKLWIDGVNIDFEEVKTGENSKRIRATFYGGTKSNIHEKIVEPIEYSGKAILEYVENGETKYFIIKEFKEYKKMQGAR
tara:strand:- start:1113 stop:1544 length:432 start_codon:yes stop_codon:yes gene_type:complete